jgi:hypothetical protein
VQALEELMAEWEALEGYALARLSAAEQAMREALESDGIDADATPRPLHEEIALMGGSQRALRTVNANLKEMISAAEREVEKLQILLGELSKDRNFRLYVHDHYVARVIAALTPPTEGGGA